MNSFVEDTFIKERNDDEKVRTNIQLVLLSSVVEVVELNFILDVFLCLLNLIIYPIRSNIF